MRRPDWPVKASIGHTRICEIVLVDIYGSGPEHYGRLFTEVYDTFGKYLGRVWPPLGED